MGTHPIFESDFDCLTDLQVMSKHDKRIMGFLPEVCTMQSESWSEQYYTVKAKFQVTTLTGLEELAYRDNCDCDVMELSKPPPCPLEIIFMVDGSESMEDNGYLKDSLAFMNNFVKGVDSDIFKKRSQEPITYTVVQFSGNSQLTKYYQPGYGYLTTSEFGTDAKLTAQKRQELAKTVCFNNRLGKATDKSYHWKYYSTFNARTVTDELDDKEQSSFGSQLKREFEDKKPLNGNSQFFLCLQDLSIAAEQGPAESQFIKQLTTKVRKYSDGKTQRVIIVLTDDKAFDNNELQDLELYNSTSDHLDASMKKKQILKMASKSFNIFPVVFKTEIKGKSRTSDEVKASLQKISNFGGVFPIDGQMAEKQMEFAKSEILAQLGLQ